MHHHYLPVIENEQFRPQRVNNDQQNYQPWSVQRILNIQHETTTHKTERRETTAKRKNCCSGSHFFSNHIPEVNSIRCTFTNIPLPVLNWKPSNLWVFWDLENWLSLTVYDVKKKKNSKSIYSTRTSTRFSADTQGSPDTSFFNPRWTTKNLYHHFMMTHPPSSRWTASEALILKVRMPPVGCSTVLSGFFNY